MSRKLFVSAAAIGIVAVLSAAVLVAPPPASGQIFVGTPVPEQFARQGQPSTKNGEWPGNGGDLAFTRYSPLDQIDAGNFDSCRCMALQDRRVRPLSGIQARRHADHGEGRALRHRRHPALRGRARCQDWRADLVAQLCARASAPPSRRASCQGAACPIGPTGAATSASSMLRPAIAWSSSMPRPAP